MAEQTCARCGKGIKEFMKTAGSLYDDGKTIVCDTCFVQELMEYGQQPNEKMGVQTDLSKPQFSGVPYWEEAEE
jgi:hypothetical protein